MTNSVNSHVQAKDPDNQKDVVTGSTDPNMNATEFQAPFNMCQETCKLQHGLAGQLQAFSTSGETSLFADNKANSPFGLSHALPALITRKPTKVKQEILPENMLAAEAPLKPLEHK